MFEKIYNNIVIEKPKFTLLILTLLLLTFGYFSKNFQLDASSDTLLLENDPDLKYLREVNSKYGTKDFLILTYTPKDDLLDSNTIENLTNLKNEIKILILKKNNIRKKNFIKKNQKKKIKLNLFLEKKDFQIYSYLFYQIKKIFFLILLHIS